MRQRLTARRVLGVDVARALALLGMMSVHIFPGTGRDGSLHPSYAIAAGRSAALFAVLAGVGIALATGGQERYAGRRLRAARAGVLVRAWLLLSLGLLLGQVDSPPLVILAYYGLLFVVAVPFLGLSPRALAVLAVVSVTVAPILSHVARMHLEVAPIGEPGGSNLVAELLLTGTYPVLPWTTYLFVGLALGRLDLRRRATALWLVAGGSVLAVAAKVASSSLLDAAGGVDRLQASMPRDSAYAFLRVDLDAILHRGLLGTTPTTDWRWLLISSPHSSTTLDLAHTSATAAGVLGACLLVTRHAPRWLYLPLAATGSMTLTLYTAHVLALAKGSPLIVTDNRLQLWLGHAVTAVCVATFWRIQVGRGPLEGLSAQFDRAARRQVEGWPCGRAQARYRGGVIKVGLTGGIGSGKSEVARLLAAHGALVVDADALAREAVAPGSTGLDEVVAEFGAEVLGPDGSLDRELLGKVVFSDPARLAALNGIVHPYVGRRSQELIAAAPEGAVVVYDVPLLVENDLQGEYDVVVVVDAPPEVQVQRLTGIRGMTEADARARMAAQATREERLAAADLVIDNTGDLAALHDRVDSVWAELANRC